MRVLWDRLRLAAWVRFCAWVWIPWLFVKRRWRTRRLDFWTLALLLPCLIEAPALPVAQAEGPNPVVEIARIDALYVPGADAWGMRGQLGDSGHYVGLGIVCATDGTAPVTVFFGAFPGAYRPVQIAVHPSIILRQSFDKLRTGQDRFPVATSNASARWWLPGRRRDFTARN